MFHLRSVNAVLCMIVGVVIATPGASLAKKVVLSKADVWPAYPFKDATYVRHETCGDPVKIRQWEAAPITGDRVWVEADAICIKLTVQAECGCRTYETTYRKYKGKSKYGYHSVGGSVPATCPGPVPAADSEKCKKERAEEARIRTRREWRVNAVNRHGEKGKEFTYSCPAGGEATFSVWGSDVYTSDSSVCAAAVHAGKITPAEGGTVTIVIVAGEPKYEGSARNGVETRPWRATDFAFRFK